MLEVTSFTRREQKRSTPFTPNTKSEVSLSEVSFTLSYCRSHIGLYFFFVLVYAHSPTHQATCTYLSSYSFC